jgi:hypothetical protein
MDHSFTLFRHIITVSICKDPSTLKVKPLSRRGKKIARDFKSLSKIGRIKALRDLSYIEGWYGKGQFMRLIDAKEWVEVAYHDYGRGEAK